MTGAEKLTAALALLDALKSAYGDEPTWAPGLHPAVVAALEKAQREVEAACEEYVR